jgi:uncharacterized OB-fold protein
MATPSSPREQSASAPKGAPAPEETAPEPPRIWEKTENGAALIGWACGQCGQRGLPRQYFGCERCGAPGSDISESGISARGVLRSWASVERHAVWPVPFLLGEVELDDGPIVHSFLSAETAWEPGMRVAGDTDDLSREPYLIFTLEEEPHGTHH